MAEPMCKECGRKASELLEYITEGRINNMTPEEFVRQEEGTYNPVTGYFYCTKCYIRVGMPLGTA